MTRSVKDTSSETRGRLVGSGKEGGENFQERAREPLGCCPQQTSSTTNPNFFSVIGHKDTIGDQYLSHCFRDLLIRRGLPCKLDCSPYLSGSARRALFENSFGENGIQKTKKIL